MIALNFNVYEYPFFPAIRCKCLDELINKPWVGGVVDRKKLFKFLVKEFEATVKINKVICLWKEEPYEMVR
jgi:hypothetical protein